MKPIHIRPLLFAVIYLLLVNIASAKRIEMTLVGSTPADAPIKSLLGIAANKNVDFIKWDIDLINEDNGGPKKFSLTVNYGVSQPNTLGFINGGEKLNVNGSYSLQTGNIYRLSNGISFLQVNNNIFQLLSHDGSLMKGGGGWSYTFNRKDPVAVTAKAISLVSTAFAPGDKSTQVIFEGRTPCMEIAGGNQMAVKEDCFKLKWKFTLNRNPTTLQPSSFTMRQVDGTAKEIEGKWTIIKENTAIIYKLEPSVGVTFYLMAGDYNVLYFVDKNLNLYQGNKDFSYTLNRRILN
ncbi:MAG: hypothetical protein EOP47_10700 [Sphingobacteriaceae bacterium]|nr:MAG: hypothetical protein EOP47_10700 [Sphingobacteriaceae bacterium]